MSRTEAADHWRSAVEQLHVNVSRGERAVHKPLLMLMLLARAEEGGPPEFSFAEVDKPLAALLREFGRPTKSVHPEYPFWYLQSDGFWVVDDASSYPLRKAGHAPAKGELLRRHAMAHVPQERWRALCVSPALRDELAARILSEYWPATLHEAIRAAVGLPEGGAWRGAARKRDRQFRDLILRIYERRCAICGFDGRLGGTDLLVEAAHVRWHSEAGPDAADNGLALCTIHHVSLDRGAIGLDEERRIIVSEHISGVERVDDYLRNWRRKPLRPPQEGHPQPGVEHVRWHRRFVFREPPIGGAAGA